MTSAPARPRVLSIAGTDPTGGAGIQADLKSFAAHGAYGMAVVTALVAQNTHGVRSTHVPGAAFLTEQLRAVSDDVTVDAVKIGMLATADDTLAVVRWLEAVRVPVVVLDPVMVSTSGHSLADDGARGALRGLLPLAHLVTPNLAELAVLTGEPPARTWVTAVEQGCRLYEAFGVAVLVKGGHLAGTGCPDALVLSDGVLEIPGERVETTTTHGTGCSLAAAIAALQPRTGSWGASVRTAKAWLTDALRAGAALGVGGGRGPVDHGAGSVAWTRSASVQPPYEQS